MATRLVPEAGSTPDLQVITRPEAPGSRHAAVPPWRGHLTGRLLRPMPRFMIFAQGRSGSTLLTEMLDSSPHVRCEGEILGAPVDDIDGLLRRRRLRQMGRAFGYKVKIYQLADHHGVHDAGRWLEEQHAAGWHVIALRRENLLRQVMSNMAAVRSGVFQQWGDSPQTPARQPLQVDPALLLHGMKIRSEQGALEGEALARVPHIALSYERDLLRPQAQQATLDRLLDQLKLPRTVVRTRLQRLTAGPVRDLVANPNEVRAAIQDTEFADMWD